MNMIPVLVPCPGCNGTGCVTDKNGVIYDDPCNHCLGEGVIEDLLMSEFDYRQQQAREYLTCRACESAHYNGKGCCPKHKPH